VLNSPGVIDSGFRGEFEVVLFAVRQIAAKLRRGDRIAQLIVIPVTFPRVAPVEALPAGSREHGGFGSSGA